MHTHSPELLTLLDAILRCEKKIFEGKKSISSYPKSIKDSHIVMPAPFLSMKTHTHTLLPLWLCNVKEHVRPRHGTIAINGHISSMESRPDLFSPILIVIPVQAVVVVVVGENDEFLRDGKNDNDEEKIKEFIFYLSPFLPICFPSTLRLLSLPSTSPSKAQILPHFLPFC